MNNKLFAICVFISFVFCGLNYYYGTNGDNCITNPNISINPKNNTNIECSYKDGCIDYRTYFYVESSILAFFIILFIVQFICLKQFFKVFASFVLICATLWSIISAYLYFNKDINDCSKKTKIYIIISTSVILFVNPFFLLLSIICRKKSNNEFHQYY
jgi:hypothetical protein